MSDPFPTRTPGPTNECMARNTSSPTAASPATPAYGESTVNDPTAASCATMEYMFNRQNAPRRALAVTDAYGQRIVPRPTSAVSATIADGWTRLRKWPPRDSSCSATRRRTPRRPMPSRSPSPGCGVKSSGEARIGRPMARPSRTPGSADRRPAIFPAWSGHASRAHCKTSRPKPPAPTMMMRVQSAGGRQREPALRPPASWPDFRASTVRWPCGASIERGGLASCTPFPSVASAMNRSWRPDTGNSTPLFAEKFRSRPDSAGVSRPRPRSAPGP